MKKYLASLFASIVAAAVVSAADPAPVFNATLTVGKEHRFVLIDAAGKPSSWLQLGDTFEGYTLKAFDAKTSTLDLDKNGSTTHVTLAADAAIGAAAMPATPATLADAQSVLDQMHFQRMMERTMAQQKAMMGKMFTQMAPKSMSAEERDEFIAFQKKMSDELVTAMGLDKMKDDVARIFSEVFTKEELQGLGAFYATPVGEALNDKQPLIQQKIQEVMMPRMMAAMPRIQQMGREFAAEQKAKREAAAAASAAATAASAPAATAAPAPTQVQPPKP